MYKTGWSALENLRSVAIETAALWAVDVKRCTACGKAKYIDDFHANRAGSKGVKSVCKLCHAAKYNPIAKSRRAELRAANPLPARKSTCMKCGERFDRIGIRAQKGGTCRYCPACAEAAQRMREGWAATGGKERDKGIRRKNRIKAQSDGTLTHEAKVALFAAAKRCPYCGSHISGSRKTLDHIVPLCSSGLHSVSNVIVCCRECNQRKSTKPLGEIVASWKIANPELILQSRLALPWAGS